MNEKEEKDKNNIKKWITVRYFGLY